MSNHTIFIKHQVDEFFKAADAGIEEVLQTREVAKRNAFMDHYIRSFPTMGDYVYRRCAARPERQGVCGRDCCAPSPDTRLRHGGGTGSAAPRKNIPQ